MNINQYRELLLSLKDQEYYDFNSSLVKDGFKIIGVRIPKLQDIAKQISKSDYEKYLYMESIYHEDKMIKALLLGYIKDDFATIINFLRNFIYEIDNWAVCDTTAANLKIFKKNLDKGIEFINYCFKLGMVYSIRLGLVLLLDYYLKEEYLDFVFEKICSTKNEDYYVKMANAWLISISYIKFPLETSNLFDGRLDKFTHNKAISKICDSFRVTIEQKEFVKTLRIK